MQFWFRGDLANRVLGGKIKAVTVAREQRIPYLGICLGMQIACIEMARNLLGIASANSTEFAPHDENAEHRGALVGMMSEWLREDGVREVRRADGDLGGHHAPLAPMNANCRKDLLRSASMGKRASLSATATAMK
jgi:CTP synthase (UTP-ammonia lyase)